MPRRCCRCGLFRQRLFTVSNTAMVVVGFALMGSVFFLSQFFVDVQGSSILRAGLQTLPTSLGMVLVSPYAGRLAARYGFRSRGQRRSGCWPGWGCWRSDSRTRDTGYGERVVAAGRHRRAASR